VKRDGHVLKHSVCSLYILKRLYGSNKAVVSDSVQYLQLSVVNIASEAPD
jgi:hypothetical protein